MTDDIVQRLHAESVQASDDDVAELVTEAADEIERLRRLLAEANEAFDDCAGNYAQDIVKGEEWRSFAPAERSQPTFVYQVTDVAQPTTNQEPPSL